MWVSGAKNQIVMLAGGWESPSVARHYTKPKHAWKLVDRYVETVGTALCSETRLPSSGGHHGYAKSSESWQPRHGQMVTFWERLGWPLGRGDAPDRKDRRRHSRHKWALERIKELGGGGGGLEIDLVCVHDKLCDQVHAKEEARMSRGGEVTGITNWQCSRHGNCGDGPCGCGPSNRVGRQGH